MLTRKTTTFFFAVALAVALAIPTPALAWTWPADGRVLRGFDFSGAAYHQSGHSGIDLGGEPGAPVAAPAAGRVSFAGWLPGNGRTVTVRTEDGFAVTLLHLGSIGVVEGDGVAEGEAVGTVGPTGDPELDGAYVHLGIRRADDPKGYVDPLTLLPPRPEPAPAPPAPRPGAPVEPPVPGPAPAVSATGAVRRAAVTRRFAASRPSGDARRATTRGAGALALRGAGRGRVGASSRDRTVAHRLAADPSGRASPLENGYGASAGSLARRRSKPVRSAASPGSRGQAHRAAPCRCGTSRPNDRAVGPEASLDARRRRVAGAVRRRLPPLRGAWSARARSYYVSAGTLVPWSPRCRSRNGFSLRPRGRMRTARVTSATWRASAFRPTCSRATTGFGATTS